MSSCGIVAQGSAVSDRRSPDISMTVSETQGILRNGLEECKSQRNGSDSVEIFPPGGLKTQEVNRTYKAQEGLETYSIHKGSP